MAQGFSKLLILLKFQKHNVAICGRSEMAAFLRVFAKKVTAHGGPQDGLVMFFLHLELPCLIYRF